MVGQVGHSWTTRSVNNYTRGCVYYEPKPFSGVFNGKGHTIYFKRSESDEYDNSVFGALNNAVIMNTNFKGLINGTGSRSNNGGIARISYGNTFILNCRSSMKMTFTGNGKGGTFVGAAMSGNLVIKDCIFDGEIAGSKSTLGGFVGILRVNTSAKIFTRNLYFAPSTRDSSGYEFIGLIDVAPISPRASIENCYFSKKMGADQGTDARGWTKLQVKEGLGENWTYDEQNDEIFPDMQSKNLSSGVMYGLEYVYAIGETVEEPVIIVDKILTKGTDYTLSTTVKPGKTGGTTYLVTATGIGSYSGELSFEYYVADEVLTSTDDELEEEVRVCGFMKDGDNYLIKTPQDLNNLSLFVNASTSNGCSGMTFVLADDIDFSETNNNFTTVNYIPIGLPSFYIFDWNSTVPRAFEGTFDGKGHSIQGLNPDVYSIGYGVFGALNGATVENLTVKNSRFNICNNINDYHNGGKGVIAGLNGGSETYLYTGDRNAVHELVTFDGGTITNCHVEDSVYVYSTQASSYAGGICGYNKGTIKGCSSAAHVVNYDSSGASYKNCTCFGGIVGQNDGTVKHCIYYGEEITADSYAGSICGDGSAETCLYTNESPKGLGDNSAIGYDRAGNDIFGGWYSSYVETCRAFVVTSGQEDLELTEDTVYGIDYGRITSSTASHLLKFDGKIYFPADVQTTVFLNYTGNIPQENLIYLYSYNSDTCYEEVSIFENPVGEAFYQIIIPSSDAKIYAFYNYDGSGTQDEPYLISDQRQLKLLQTLVNRSSTTLLQTLVNTSDEGNVYKDKYFALKNDISITGDFTPIGGCYNGALRNFGGTFDGKNYSLSGVNISKTGTEDDAKYLGVFGRITTDATIKNLCVKDSSINGYFAVGSVCGFNSGTIEGCTVDSSVTLSYSESTSNSFGGIAGYNEGTIKGSTSKSKISCATCAGGICGNNSGTINSCLYIDEDENSISALSYAGSIVGYNANGSLTSNIYIKSSLRGQGKASGSTDVSGAKKAYSISSDVASLALAENSSGFTYNSSLYCESGKSVSLSLSSLQESSNASLGLCSLTEDENFNFNSIEDGVYNFTMPSYDVKIAYLANVVFETNGGTSVESQTVVLGQTLKAVESPTVSDGKVFEGWYTDSSLTNEFDFSSAITQNLTLYASYSEGITVKASEDPCTFGVYYTTFYSSSKNYRADTNTSVFYVTKTKEGKILIEEEESRIINKGKGVILKSSTQKISLLDTSLQGSYTYTNILTGTDEEITAPEGTYIMGISKKGGVGFYKWTGTIKAGKAYLQGGE